MEGPASYEPLLMRRPRPPSQSYLNAPFHAPPSVKKAEKHPERNLALDQVELDHHCNFVIHPLHPKGPSALPPSKIIHSKWYEQESSQVPPPHFPQFTLNDFLQNSREVKYLKSKLERAAISRDNYLKMTGWFATQQPTHTTLTVTELQGTHAPSL